VSLGGEIQTRGAGSLRLDTQQRALYEQLNNARIIRKWKACQHLFQKDLLLSLLLFLFLLLAPIQGGERGRR